MEIVTYLRVLRRRWQLVFAMGVLGLVIGVSTVLLVNVEKTAVLYKATHTLIASDNTANLNQLRSLAIDGDVPKRVADKVGGGSAPALVAQISVDAKPEIGMISINAFNSDPQRAVQLADAFAQELKQYRVELATKQRDGQIANLKQSMKAAEDDFKTNNENLLRDPANKEFYNQNKTRASQRYTDLQKQIDELQNATLKGTLSTASTAQAVPVSGKAVAAIIAGNTSTTSKGSKSNSASPTTEDVATALGESSGPGPTTRGALGGALGIFVGAALALTIERLDPRIRTKEDAEEVFGFPVVAETPPLTRRQQRETEVLAWEQPRSRTAEAYRVLRSAVQFSAEADGAPLPTITNADRPDVGRSKSKARVLMITSASPSEGKTTTAANLAAVLGEAGLRVLVVNCDFRRPRVHAFLGVDTKPAEIVETDVAGVSLMNRVASRSVSVNPAEVVAIQRRVVREHLTEYDVIVLDTAPMLTTNDAAELLPVADQVLVVARAGRTTKEAADRTAELLDRREAPVGGVVLIGATDGPGGRYYYYGSGRNYYLDDTIRRGDRRRDAGRASDTPPQAMPASASQARSAGGDGADADAGSAESSRAADEGNPLAALLKRGHRSD